MMCCFNKWSRYSLTLLSLLILLCFLAGCVNKRLENTTINSSPTPNKPITIFAKTPRAHDGVCERQPSQKLGQTNYLGIVVGQTTKEEVQEMWGKPSQIYVEHFLESWLYNLNENHPSVVVKIQDNKVVSLKRKIWDEPKQLEQILVEFGCPDLIYRLDLTVEKSGWYRWTLFVYAYYGVQFIFDEFPPTQTTITEVEYFPSVRPGQYLATNYYLSELGTHKKIFWQDLPK